MFGASPNPYVLLAPDLTIATMNEAYLKATMRERLIAQEQVDSAVLDVNVHGTLSYAVAQLLFEREIPFIFATGYGDRSHPAEFADVPTVSKPYSANDIRKALLTRKD